MPLNDSAVFLPERCFIHYAPLGSTVPTDAIVGAYDPDGAPDFLSTVVSEVQTLTITGTPTGGTFTLSFGGRTTTAIAYNATPAAVQAALIALPNVNANDVVVTGTAGGPYTVTYSGALAGQDVPPLTATGTFTGGTTPAVNVATSTPGGTGTYAAWRHLGHTDLDEDIEGDEDGGDTETRGTRQRPNLRTIDEPVTDFFTINSVQFSADTLKLYYGGGIETAGNFAAPVSKKAQDLMVLLIYVDGDRKLGELHRKCSVKRGGPISREAENFLRAPLRFTPLDPGVPGVGDTEWLSVDLFDAA